MKDRICFLIVTAVIATNSSSLHGQAFFSETFNGSSISTNLIVPPEYSVNNGKLGSFAGRPPFYVRTVDSNYNNVDFRAGITIHLNNGASGDGIAFFGIGSGVGDPNWHNQPTYAGYGYLIPSAWGGGSFQIDGIDVPSEFAQRVARGEASWNNQILLNQAIGNRARMELIKVGGSLTFSLDPNFDNQNFNPTVSQTVSIANYMPFLNSTNSKIFFGAGGGSQFSDLNIVPEPSSLALLLAGGAVLMAGRRRKLD